ncbi:hypothetical protein IC582_012847 [Cucumis melo]|uniref:Phylloplanin-like n=2 Tax=Cucumis melo TaxID=3656 RepID=A0A1S3AXJ8_CUCME|nr:phylloplanin-like [Cucumis melo]KAA0049504.1 phylloplanin-like [Cucumis melo var. makuwa]TYK16184.1 phylloplanin-like [Cucumis melo var. makuwa]
MGLKSKMLVMVMVIGALGSAPLMAEAQLGNIIGSLLGVINVQGVVYCTADGNIGTINATSTPVFPNAVVQLQCGNGNIVSTTTTNNMGSFSMLLNPLQFLLSTLLTDCNVVVRTPLINCNATLPSTGFLTSRMQFVGRFVQDGIMEIMKVAPNLFTFISPSA